MWKAFTLSRETHAVLDAGLQWRKRVTGNSTNVLLSTDSSGARILAPIGTIWGDAPWHFSRRTGGHGIGEFSTSTVGSQFRPAAPDWFGQQIEYTVLVSDSRNADQLDLFAHPPLVRVGTNQQ